MVRRIAFVIAGLVALALIRPVYLVGVGFNLWQPFTRPVGVSSRAHYVDAFKTAAWFDCSVNTVKNVDVCRAWDRNGKLIAFGNYRLDGEGRAATMRELRPSMVQAYPDHPNLAWIYLFDDSRTIAAKTLVPVDEAGKPLEQFRVIY